MQCQGCGFEIEDKSICPYCGSVRGASSPADEEIRQHLKSRNKVAAVKVFRSRANCQLKDAKDAVDKIEAQMRQLGELPPSRSGCSVAAAFLFFLLGLCLCLSRVVGAGL